MCVQQLLHASSQRIVRATKFIDHPLSLVRILFVDELGKNLGFVHSLNAPSAASLLYGRAPEPLGSLLLHAQSLSTFHHQNILNWHLALHFRLQPCFGIGPLTFGRRCRNAKDFGRFAIGQADKIPHFY